MKDTVESRKVIGTFVGKYIGLAIIIGTISFMLENLVPQMVDMEFTATLIIYQSVLFVISTLLTIILAVSMSIKKVKIETQEEAARIAKPIKTILMIVALLIMTANLVYCYQIEQHGYKNVEEEYKTIPEEKSEYKEEKIRDGKDTIHRISNVYLGTREIITLLTYAYAVIYIEKMIEVSVVESIEEKEETKKTTRKKTTKKDEE